MDVAEGPELVGSSVGVESSPPEQPTATTSNMSIAIAAHGVLLYLVSLSNCRLPVSTPEANIYDSIVNFTTNQALSSRRYELATKSLFSIQSYDCSVQVVGRLQSVLSTKCSCN